MFHNGKESLTGLKQLLKLILQLFELQLTIKIFIYFLFKYGFTEDA